MYSLASKRISHVHHSHPELIMEDRVECLLEVYKARIEWLLVLSCFVHQYSEIRDLVSCLLPCLNPACSSAISVSVFTRILSSMLR